MGAETFAVMALAGGALKAYGQYEQGKQIAGALDYNAGLSEERAQAARASADLNEYKKRKVASSVIGSQQATFGKAGVLPTTGSPIDVMTDSLSNSYLDIAIDNYNSEVAARGFEAQAQMDRYAGKQAKREGKLNAVTTLLSSGAEYGRKQTIGA